jgi:NAD(P)-dependent dehydrogenase (short-subunit alcohol dehydrogenase family)
VPDPPPTVVVTGASAGIGAAAAVMLTSMGADVLATGRTPSKLDAVHARMVRAAPDGLVVRDPVAADFAGLDEVRRLADLVCATFPRLDVLVNNAGITASQREESADGYELVLAVNHLAPFLLTDLLTARLRESGGRVVTTSSFMHRFGRIDLDDLQLARKWSGTRAYSRSKLANILFTTELRRRTGLAATAFNPGGVATDLHRDRDGAVRTGVQWMRRLLRTPEDGADTLVWLATTAEGAQPSAPYYSKRKPGRLAAGARDADVAARLWELSAEMVR